MDDTSFLEHQEHPAAPPAGRSVGIVESIDYRGGVYADMLIREPRIASEGRPGQFVMIRNWPDGGPYLSRPFDIMLTDPDAGTFRLFIKMEGPGTRRLGEAKPGSEVSVIGPLGVPIDLGGTQSLATMVRGAGAAAVVFLSHTASRAGIAVHTVVSAASKERLVCLDYLDPVSTSLLIATDDGSAGYHGNAMDLLDGLLEAGPAAHSIERVYTCGSRRFARHVKKRDAEGATEGWVFVETYMGCGLGDCHSCAVPREGGPGYFLVCRDGPVFRTSEVRIV
jgi:dihydroorotate dehydrogenase electron transfer subunit